MSNGPRPREMPVLKREALRRRLEHVVTTGNRFAGTPGEARCRDLIADQLAAAGLADVRLEEFRYLGYEPERSSCVVLEDGWSIPCAALQYTADAASEGEAVYLGACRPEDVEAVERRGLDLAGRVAVAHSYHTWLVAPQLANKGVAALVNVGETPDGLIGHFPVSFYPVGLEPPWEGRILPFPGVTVEALAARRLLSLMSAGPVRLRVEHRGRYVEKTAANVLGELPGDSDEVVVVGAHYDTQLEGPGAADDGSGVATLLELARAWRGFEARRTVIFSGFAVEELGAFGSYNYVVRHADENERTVGMVNLDALGLPFPGRRVVVADAAMTEFARAAAAEAGWEAEGEIDASLYAWGDHNPFIDAGIPACWLWCYPPQHPYYHSAGDIMRYVDLDRMHEVATASAYLALRLAELPELELGRSRPTQTFAAIR
jgi:aminopeptidase YwaD